MKAPPIPHYTIMTTLSIHLQTIHAVKVGFNGFFFTLPTRWNTQQTHNNKSLSLLIWQVCQSVAVLLSFDTRCYSPLFQVGSFAEAPDYVFLT